MIIQSDKIIWDKTDWLAGLNPQYGSTSAGLQQAGGGLGSANAFNPFRQLGYASPGEVSQDMTNASIVDGALQRFITYDNVNAFAIGGTKLHKITLSTQALINTGNYPHSITAHSGTASGKDGLLYKIGTTTYLFYLWKDAIGGYIGRDDFSAAPDDDWLFENAGGDLAITSITSASTTATVTTTAAHGMATGDIVTIRGADQSEYNGTYSITVTGASTFTYTFASSGTSPATGTITYLQGLSSDTLVMIKGADDILYIGDGNKIHAFDGQTGDNGTFSYNVLDLPSDYTITGFARIRPYKLAIFATSNYGTGSSGAQSTVFFWDYLSETYDEPIELGNGTVGGAFEYQNNTIGCFISSASIDRGYASRSLQLLIWDGVRFVQASTILSSALPVVGGVDVLGDVIYFNSGGTIYTYGSPFEEIESGLNKIANAQGSTSGAFKNIGGIQYCSSGTTTAGGAEYYNGKYEDGANASSVMAYPQFP